MFETQIAKIAMGKDALEGGPKNKKAKLAQLLHFKSKLPDHSQSALAAIVEEIKKVVYQSSTLATTRGKPGSNWSVNAMVVL